ncbi:hypothetical protein [Pseudoalteromonas marina]|uniref:Uncharacterized protein n=1 Tax=Pseudoalteromonas marina TaxID=267375 RepID=A0ABT9FCE0_9GAMM|nr:hypothetical protein [Pseudoalteromonas marina]MDP2564416.1 hypothetical protein [Pseudoalteromonas marina]
MATQHFQLPARDISKNIEKKYIGDIKTKNRSPWLYDVLNSTDIRLNQIRELIIECQSEGVEISSEVNDEGMTIYCDGFLPETININDKDIESTLKHVICRLFVLLNPEEQAHNLIGAKKNKKATEAANRFSYIDFVIDRLDETTTSCPPSSMIRAAKNAGAPHKGEELEHEIRQACETIAGRKGYAREQTKGRSGYSYKRVQITPDQLSWF